MPLLLCLPLVAHAEPRFVDRSVALVNGHVITFSELQFESRVYFVHKGGVEAAFGPLDTDTLRKTLDLLIGQRLETGEADKLKAYPLEEGELTHALQSFSARLGGPSQLERFLKQFEADESMLALVLARTLRTQRLLDGKLRLKAQVSEAEASRVQSERADLKGLAVTAVRQRLFSERFTALTAAELAAVRKAAAVRLLGPFAAAADGGLL